MPASRPLQSDEESAVRAGLRRFLGDLAINAVVPLVLYHAIKRTLSVSDFEALLIAAFFPAAKGGFDLIRRRELNPVSVIILLGMAGTVIAGIASRSPRVLLLRESMFTGSFGVICLLSLFLPRPLMFYFGYHFLVRGEPLRRRRYEAGWNLPEVRHASRLVTLVWGVVLIAEFGIRALLVWKLSPASVLAVSPVTLGALTLGAVLWTFRYVRRIREKVLPKIEELLHRGGPT